MENLENPEKKMSIIKAFVTRGSLILCPSGGEEHLVIPLVALASTPVSCMDEVPNGRLSFCQNHCW